jgi:deoxyribodipyrimidine photo-lyase
MHSPLVWFKRDLRVHDHAAVHAAVERAPGRPWRALYILEPSLWRQPDASRRQLAFVLECLADLASDVRAHGGELWVRRGEACEVLEQVHAEAPFDALLAHEETGNGETYRRDQAVAAWCRSRRVAFKEWPQTGVVRRLRNRDGWHHAWEGFMRHEVWPTPARSASPTRPTAWSQASLLDLAAPELASFDGADAPSRQRGGRHQALLVLDDFLRERCENYRGGISSPLSAPEACSRLSPYLAHGCLSVRELVQATQARMDALSAASRSPGPGDPECARQQQAGLKAFLSRLHWHCHFIQKLESEPEIEWRNVHRGHDGLREGEFDEARFAALRAGRTGWPLVDACVAMLRETGWINFRMRAMLVSVATYPLWLHWRPVGEWLARQFVDYEPGIHWSQMQMQAGTTGINTTRVYNPTKQACDQDPKGDFVRRWLPAMRSVPDTWLFEPWRMPEDIQARCGLRVGSDPDADIPVPMVDLEAALKQAKARMHARRAEPAVRAANAGIVQRHGSRTNRDGRGRAGVGARQPHNTTAATSNDSQLTLGF